MRRYCLSALTALLAVCAGGASLRAETFVLATGGRIEGQLLNADQSPRQSYVVALATGCKVTFSKSQVTRVLAANSVEGQYEQYLQKMPDTAEGHWKMAEWCVRNNLSAQREFHLREVARLDPGHEKAHLALGFTNIDGRWVRPDEHNKRLGYVKFQGAWRTPQDVAIATARQQVDDAERKWKADVKMWRGWLNRPSKANEGAARLQAIDNPLASPAIAELLDDKEEPAHYRLMYVEILGRMVLQSPLARGTLVNHTLYDSEAQVREKCLDHLEKCNHRVIGGMFAKALGDKKNEVVNRAAVGIARMKDEESIPQLIDALVTKHKYVVSTGGGNIGASFGGGPGAGGLGGLSAGGGGPKQIEQEHQNDSVQQALVALTGGKNFGFDRDAWRSWYAESKVPQQFNLRRGR
jgi:hypothetical protein